MNKRSLHIRGADLSSRRVVEDAIESAKSGQDLTWEEAAKRPFADSPKRYRRPRRRSADKDDARQRHLD